MRLDIFLTKHYNIQSRNKAQELIDAKKIKINGDIITKSSFKIEDKNINLEILDENFYVSRSALKLKYFFDDFKDIDIFNKIALDIGSSTGGFTQVLLQMGAKNVTCVDVGTDQLNKKIKDNPKVKVFENTNIKDFHNNIKYDFITCDVSFVSVLNILKYIDSLAKKEIIILFKPQFEVGIDIKRDKKGVVVDNDAIKKSKDRFLDEASKLKWSLIYRQVSNLKGKNGNSEELFYFQKKYDIDSSKITNIAIGGFDGIHMAHKKLFENLDSNGAILVIQNQYANLTKGKTREFYTHFPYFYLNLEDIKDLNGEQFVKLLIEQFPLLEKIVVGFDFHFGKNRAFSTANLKEFFKKKVKIVDEVKINNIAVHSQTIRKYLNNSYIKKANKLLGRQYKITGIIIKGQGLGEKNFVPTINLQCDDFLIPKSAVYITKTIIDNTQYNSITFIGHRATTDGKFAIETHIIDKDITSLSKKIDIKFYEKLRENQKFNSFADLKKQILEDIKSTTNYFTHHLNFAKAKNP
jgi:riboflavin kinase/FMN adenylyltransferase